ISSRSKGVAKVEFSRDRIAWVSRSPSCSQSARRLAFISGSTKSSTMSSNSLAASARLSPAASNKSKKDSSRGKIRSFTSALPYRRAGAETVAAGRVGCRQMFTARSPRHHLSGPKCLEPDSDALERDNEPRVRGVALDLEPAGVQPDDRTAHQQLPRARPPGSAVEAVAHAADRDDQLGLVAVLFQAGTQPLDRKSTRLNSSHVRISYAVFCLKKK